jgi:hypothetical protein
VTSTCTEYPSSGAAVYRPAFTMSLNPASLATSQPTLVRPVMPPSGSRGLGASLVQMTTSVLVGSPEATPSMKGSPAARGIGITRHPLGMPAHRNDRRARSARKSRRFMAAIVGGLA